MSGIVTGTVAGKGPLAAGSRVLKTITATITSADDAITLTEAIHGIKSIEGIIGAVISTGLSSTFATIQVARSGLTLTVVSKNATGSTATSPFGTVEIGIIGKLES